MGWKFKKTLVILISGKAGTGKDTVAKYLMDYLRENSGESSIVKLGFAWGVKQAALDYFGWNLQKDEKGRRLLQGIGRIGREYNPFTWPITMMNRIYELYGGVIPSIIVVSDWRFPNEAEYFDKFPELFKVTKVRVESPDRECLKGTPEYNDISEISLPGGYEMPEFYGYIINNTGTKEELEKVCEALADEILKGE